MIHYEAILHDLAEEGKAKAIKSFLKKDESKELIVGYLLLQDNLGNTPVMSATNANKESKEIIEMFLHFLLDHMTNSKQLESLMMASNKFNETLFTLLLRNVGKEDFSQTRSLLFSLLQKHSDSGKKMEDWFFELTKQVRESKAINFSSSSMKELIRLGAEVGIDFKSVLVKKSTFGNTLLMKLAMEMKDEALREILTNTRTSKYVSFTIIIVPKIKLLKFIIFFSSLCFI